MRLDPRICFPSVWIVVGVVCLGPALGGCRSEETRIRKGRRLFERARFQKAAQALAPLFEGPQYWRSRPDSTTLLYGRVLLARGALRRARDTYRQLRGHSGRFRDAALYGLARTHFYLGHPDTAQVLSRQLLKRGRAEDNSLRVAQAYHVLGRANFYEANYDQALEQQRASLCWARRAERREVRANALRQIGVLHWYRGRVDTAKKAFYEPALRLYRQVGDSIGVATTLSNIGLIHWQKGEWRKHTRYQLRAFAVRKRMGDQIGLADSYSFLAEIPGEVGLQTPGYQTTYLRKSLELSQRIGYAWGEQVAIQRLTKVLGRNLSYRDSTLSRLRGEKFRRSGEHRFLRQIRAARDVRRRGEWNRADSLFAEAHRLADSLGYYNFQRSTLITRSRVLVELGRWNEALSLLHRIKTLDEEGTRPWTRDRATQVRATIALRRGDSARAADLLRPLAAELDHRYLQALHETAPEVAFEAAAGLVHGRRASVYGRLVEALKERRGDEAFRFMERERALPYWGGTGKGEKGRETVSRLVRRLERLDQTSGHSGDVQAILKLLEGVRKEQLAGQRVLDRTGATEKDVRVTSKRALRSALHRGEVFVEYFVGKERHHLFVARRDSSRFLTISVPRATLANTTDVYRSTLRRGREHPRETVWRASGRRLFNILLRPLIRQGWIQPGDHLLIAPHRRLWGVPFHALPVPSDGVETRFLIDRNLVSYVRSATDVVEQRTRPPQPLRSALAVAPAPDALPHTKRELEHVRATPFARKRVLVGEAARKAVVQEAWTNYDVVHMAAHAHTNTQFPLYSPLEVRDGRIELYEILEDSLRARVVVLSACETGQNVGATGKAPTGASVVGFPRAFLRAGAGSVVGSLWRVDDAATARLMQHFYGELVATRSSSSQDILLSSRPGQANLLTKALAQAQRAYLERARRSDVPAHPFYWAGFALIGDGR